MRRHAGKLILAVVLLWGPVLLGPRTGLPAAERTAYIEVHGPDIAYVPMTETHVKFDGEIRKILGFTATVNEGGENCPCPRCCDGWCYIIVYTDLFLPGGPVRTPVLLWMECRSA